MVFLVLLITGSAKAETVSQKQASQMAELFYNAAHGEKMASPKVVYNGRRLTTHSLFVPFYIYNFPAGGYVIISAENKAYPILGYDLSNSFDPDKMGEKQKALLRSYALDIERIRYDERIPYSAIEAWNNYPDFVSTLLQQTPEITDMLIYPEDAEYAVSRIIATDEGESSSSTYSPDQWSEAINIELQKNQNAILGIYANDTYLPVIIQGHKGDYYRMSLDRPNNGMFRLFATEYYSDGQIAQLSEPKKLEIIEEEEEPFTFYESFLAEIGAKNDDDQRAIEEIGLVNEPEVSFLGGGHYVINLPENIIRMNIYNVGGNLLIQKYFKNTDTAHLDISEEPNGFYIALIEGVSGQRYGFKLAR